MWIRVGLYSDRWRRLYTIKCQPKGERDTHIAELASGEHWRKTGETTKTTENSFGSGFISWGLIMPLPLLRVKIRHDERPVEKRSYG